MSFKNMNYGFNVKYFEGLDLLSDNQQVLEKRNDELCQFKFEGTYGSDFLNKGIPDYMEFKLTTTYPGLLIGLGNPHNIKSKGAIKTGFTFDYVTGLPYMEGSYLKGVLSSPFPRYECLIGQKPMDELEKEKLSNIEETLEAYGEIEKTLSKEDKRERVKELEELLFENTRISYLGVFPVIRTPVNLMKTDFITKHEELKNPNPVGILKIKEDIVFRFCFSVPESNKYDREKIVQFFKQIILIWGIGAKTNVGYGQFCEKDEAPVDNKDKTDSKPVQNTSERKRNLCKRCNKNETRKKPDSDEYYLYCPECYRKMKKS